MATEKQIEANRRNALKSRGPSTTEGKERSRQNALKHGLTAETLDVLPNEDRALFEGRIEAWLRDLGARNDIEDSMIRRAATLSWKLDRADRYEVSVLTKRIHDQAEVDKAEHRERIPQLIDRLLPPIEEIQQSGFDPTPAGRILQEIESTAEGCRWILRRWEQLRKAVDDRREWTQSEEVLMVRLTEHGHVTIDNAQTLDLIVASRVMMWPNGPLDADRWEAGLFSLRLDRDALRDAIRRRPATQDEAAGILNAAIDKGIARMEIVLKLRERDGDNWGAEESANRASFDPSAEGERLRRYQTTTQRDMIRALESVAKLRSQAVNLQKEEAKLAVVGSFEPDPAVLRNEPNLGTEDTPTEPTGDSKILQSVSATPGILRNEPKFDREAASEIDIAVIGQGAESSSIPLRVAS